jgi:hypothetical protein
MTSEVTRMSTISLREWPEPPRAVRVLAGCIVVMGILGGYDALVADTHALDLQAELAQGFTLPAPFSGALLVGVAAFCVLLSAGPATGVVPRWVWGVFTVLFIEAAADEAASIHETLGNAAGIDWMVLYTPLFIIAGVLWLKVLRGLEGRPERVVWLSAAAAWVFAQMLEVYAYGGTEEARPGTGPLSAVEELMEMTGSLLLLWTVLALYRSTQDRQ